MPRAIAIACAVIALLIGIERGAFFGAGPDESGYVSQADKWARGAPLISAIPQWAITATWFTHIESAVPAGYAPDPTRTRMVPVYSPGLPWVMALFQRIGGPEAVFYVVPIFGALVIWSTFLLGRDIAGAWAGAVGAMLMLVSPPFLRVLVRAMSDVPAAACWSAAVLFACRPRARDALLAGAAAAAGTLIRANTAPLIIVPALLLWSRREHRWRRLLLLAAAMVPATAVLAALYAHWYGSPLNSGYGALSAIYSVGYAPTNARRYLEWFLQTQTPLAFLWLAAPLVVVGGASDSRQRLIIVAVVYPLAVFALYIAYMPWGEWGYLRFLLPAFPAMCASFGAVCVAFVSQVTPRRLALAAVIAVVASLGSEQWRFAKNEGVFRNGKASQRFARAVDFANNVEPDAIILSDAYSGTLRFYTKRDILRWQMPAPQEIDHVLEQLHDAGHPLYFVGDPFEEQNFKIRYANAEVSRWFETGRIPDIGFGFVAASLTPRR